MISLQHPIQCSIHQGDGRVDGDDASGGQDLNNNGIDDAIEAGISTCGSPTFDPAVDKALFVWQACDGPISIVASGADGSASYTGFLVSDEDLVSVSVDSVEASDTVSNVPLNRMAFDLSVGGGFFDRIDVSLATDASACVDVTDVSDAAAVLVGPGRIPVTPPFDPLTLQTCELPAQQGCGDPQVVPETDPGAFVWQECGGLWHMDFIGISDLGTVSYAGSVSSDQPLSDVQRTSAEASDTLTQPDSRSIQFEMVTVHPWSDGFEFFAPTDAALCVDVSALPAAVSVYSGPQRTIVSGPFNPQTLESCTPAVAQCGNPVYDASTERALLTWIDCEGDLHIRGVGAQAGARYIGHVHSDIAFSAVEQDSYESGDIGTLADANDVFFDMTMGGVWYDELIVTPGDGAELCIAVDAQSAGTQLFAGVSKTPVTSPFNPVTLENCNPPDNGNCGDPLIDPAADAGLFVWKECDGRWNLLVTGDPATAGVSYTGTVNSSTGFTSITTESVEASDTVSTELSAPLAFDLSLGYPWSDRILFTVDEGADLCVTISDMPASLGRFAGVDRAPVSFSFDPVTLGDCN